MDTNVKKAIEDVTMIKNVMERTKEDFSKIASYFLWIGVVNGISFVIEQIAYYIRNVSGYTSFYGIIIRFSKFLPILGYIVCFVCFYHKIRKSNHDISKGILKTWGIVLIGSQVFDFLYMWLIPAGNNETINVLWRCKELVIILPVIFAFFMTGILTKRRSILILTALYSVLYLCFFISMKEVGYGTWGGIGTRVSISSILIRVIMIIGMAVLGVYLKGRGKKYGVELNTGSLSN